MMKHQRILTSALFEKVCKSDGRPRLNLISILTTFMFILSTLAKAKVNLTFPYRNLNKKKSKRFTVIKCIFYIIFLFFGVLNEESKVNDYDGPGYEPPFSHKNILSVFSSENIDIFDNPFYTKLTSDWFPCEECAKELKNQSRANERIKINHNINVNNGRNNSTTNISCENSAEVYHFKNKVNGQVKIQNVTFEFSIKYLNLSKSLNSPSTRRIKRSINKMNHIKNGNRNGKRKTIDFLYWNKGSMHLHRKMPDIKTLIEEHRPHVFALGEANVLESNDIEDVKIPNYDIHLAKSINNQDIKVARIALYTSKQLIVKRRSDLENDTVQTIWLELGLPQQKKSLVMAGYRQWRLPGQGQETVSVPQQKARWNIILEQWERALKEEKEVIVMMDANLDSLTWTKDSNLLPPNHSSIKLRSLAEDLFGRIYPYGVSMLVREATRAENGAETSCLDHVYTNKPEKLAPVQTFWTGMSDHKLIKVKRFSKSIQNRIRYTRKRIYKNFDKEEFQRRVKEMPELREIEQTSN